MAIAIVGMLDEREAGLGVIKDHIEKEDTKPCSLISASAPAPSVPL